MTSEKLNMTGNNVASDLLKMQSEVYFYKPPSQQEALRLGRKAKHCQHYHGPARITKKIGNQSYEIEFQGHTYQRDQGMLIPAKHRTKVSKASNIPRGLISTIRTISPPKVSSSS